MDGPARTKNRTEALAHTTKIAERCRLRCYVLLQKWQQSGQAVKQATMVKALIFFAVRMRSS